MSTKTLRSIAPSSTRAASYLCPSPAGFITIIAESTFSVQREVRDQAALRLLRAVAHENATCVIAELISSKCLVSKNQPHGIKRVRYAVVACRNATARERTR
jgi:hypothetical protein